jgi:hypothetical protein
MSDSAKLNPDEKFAEELRSRQRNVVWPDLIQGGGRIDAVLGRPSASRPMVQRLAGWLLGIVMILIAVNIFSLAESRIIASIISLGFVACGSWLIYVASSGLGRSKKQ